MSEKIILTLIMVGAIVFIASMIATYLFIISYKEENGDFQLEKATKMLQAKKLEHEQRVQLEGPKN